MAASSIAFARFRFVDGTCGDWYLDMPAHAVPRDEAFAALVEEIRQVVSDPPLLFKVVVAGGLVIAAAGGFGVASCLLGLVA